MRACSEQVRRSRLRATAIHYGTAHAAAPCHLQNRQMALEVEADGRAFRIEEYALRPADAVGSVSESLTA